MLGCLRDFGPSNVALSAFMSKHNRHRSLSHSTAAGLQAAREQALPARLRSADPEALCRRLAVVAVVAVAPAKDVVRRLLAPLDLLA